MIDLKELERRLDESLANETTESLSNWLFEQRKKEMDFLLGKGTIIECISKPNTRKIKSMLLK